MKKKQVKCYTYIRVSTLTQADNFSLDAQRERLHKYAEYQDMVILQKHIAKIKRQNIITTVKIRLMQLVINVLSV